MSKTAKSRAGFSGVWARRLSSAAARPEASEFSGEGLSASAPSSSQFGKLLAAARPSGPDKTRGRTFQIFHLSSPHTHVSRSPLRPYIYSVLFNTQGNITYYDGHGHFTTEQSPAPVGYPPTCTCIHACVHSWDPRMAMGEETKETTTKFNSPCFCMCQRPAQATRALIRKQHLHLSAISWSRYPELDQGG